MAQPEVDREADELRALAEIQGFVRYYEEARELQERELDEAERDREVWEKYEAAVSAKLTAQEKLSLYFIMLLAFLTSVVVAIFELIRGFL